MKTYTATFKRDGNGVWLVELVEEARVHTYGRTLAKARENIRDATALWFDVAPTSFELVDDVHLPRKAKSSVARAHVEREKAQAVQDNAMALSRDAARALVEEEHLTLRDAAEILGLSHQRVQQLLAQGAA